MSNTGMAEVGLSNETSNDESPSFCISVKKETEEVQMFHIQ